MLFSKFQNSNINSENKPMVDLEVEDGLAIVTIDRPTLAMR